MPGLLIGDVIRRAARVVPRRLAATLGDAELTFGELDERSNRVGHALRGMGIAHRDRVAWWGDTSLDVMPVFGALAKLGAAFAPVNARLGAAEAAEVVAYARPRMLVVHAAHREMVDGWDVPVVTRDELARAPPTSTSPRSTSATRTSCSSRAAAPAGRRGS